MMDMPENGVEDFSASATVITFDPPIALLRGPFPASPSDDPSLGPFVLAFRDEGSWRSAYQATESKLIKQCQKGVRVGCAISASAKCKPPWWKTMFGVGTVDLDDCQRCEEREMSACIAASEESCIQFAREKCLPAFHDAWIATTSQKVSPKLMFGPSSNSDSDFPISGQSQGV